MKKAIAVSDYNKVSGGSMLNPVLYQINGPSVVSGGPYGYGVNGGDVLGCGASLAQALKDGGKSVIADVAAVASCYNVVQAANNIQPAAPAPVPNGTSQINQIDRR